MHPSTAALLRHFDYVPGVQVRAHVTEAEAPYRARIDRANETAEKFQRLAHWIAELPDPGTPGGRHRADLETAMALRKLLEAKDCAVRAQL